jgi:uncharacterized iron-regulated protein
MSKYSNFVLLSLLGAAGVLRAQAPPLNLSIGDSARKDQVVAVALDAIIDTVLRDTIAPQQLTDRLGDRRLVLIGEQHTDAAYHAVQLRVLELLLDHDRPLMIGLEMFPVERQASLDGWTAGDFSEEDFLEDAEWYRTWGYHWGYYRDIFLLARAHGIPMIALDQRPITGAEIAANLDSEDHRTLLQAYFETDNPVHGGLTPEQFDTLFAAQSKRDAVMARNAVDALRAQPERTMVLLAGTGHVAYGLGILRQLPLPERESATTIMPVPIDSDETSIRASVADFLWGVPEADYPLFPELGVLTTATDDGLQIIHIEDDTPAARGDLTVGDVLTTFNAIALTQRADLGRALAPVQWGDEVTIELLRDDQLVKVTLALRR